MSAQMTDGIPQYQFATTPVLKTPVSAALGMAEALQAKSELNSTLLPYTIDLAVRILARMPADTPEAAAPLVSALLTVFNQHCDQDQRPFQALIKQRPELKLNLL